MRMCVGWRLQPRAWATGQAPGRPRPGESCAALAALLRVTVAMEGLVSYPNQHPFRIDRVVTREFLGLRECTVDIKGLTFLCGPNSVGKSSPMKALAVLLQGRHGGVFLDGPLVRLGSLDRAIHRRRDGSTAGYFEIELHYSAELPARKGQVTSTSGRHHGSIRWRFAQSQPPSLELALDYRHLRAFRDASDPDFGSYVPVSDFDLRLDPAEDQDLLRVECSPYDGARWPGAVSWISRLWSLGVGMCPGWSGQAVTKTGVRREVPIASLKQLVPEGAVELEATSSFDPDSVREARIQGLRAALERVDNMVESATSDDALAELRQYAAACGGQADVEQWLAEISECEPPRDTQRAAASVLKELTPLEMEMPPVTEAATRTANALGVDIAGSAAKLRDLASFVFPIGPLRARQSLSYYRDQQFATSQHWVGLSGERTVQVLLQHPTVRDGLAEWIRALELGDSVEVHAVPGIGDMLRLVRDGVARTLEELGAGTSQVVPIVVQGLAAPKGSVVLVEQPELHLHPALQGRLTDFFLHCSQERDVSFVVETHSEHIINRARLRVAEGDDPGLPRSIAIYFFQQPRTPEEPPIVSVELGVDGDIVDWPAGFFDETPGEWSAITRAALRRRRRSTKQEGEGDGGAGSS